MKKKLFALAVLAICAATAASSTLAYFTSQTQAHNVITTGGVAIEIVEYSNGVEIKDGVMPDSFKNVMPGATVSKEVTVKNQDEAADAWIRAKVDVSVKDPGENTLDAGVIDIIYKLSADTWIKGDEGYYYYTKPVAPGTATEPLFENVQFSGPEMGNEYQNCTVEIDIYAQAVQYKNNPIPADGDVTGIKGWPNH